MRNLMFLIIISVLLLFTSCDLKSSEYIQNTPVKSIPSDTSKKTPIKTQQNTHKYNSNYYYKQIKKFHKKCPVA